MRGEKERRKERRGGERREMERAKHIGESVREREKKESKRKEI